MISNQHGDPSVIDNQELLPVANRRVEITADRAGVIARLEALPIGRAANLLGAGRFTKDDVIDPAVGIEVICKVGARVTQGQPLAVLHINDDANLSQAKDMVKEAYTIGDRPTDAPKLILERVTA